ncbi:MAG TPA: MFS transporter [Ruania sp.]|nr:MFS transporter [Ruania sp.]
MRPAEQSHATNAWRVGIISGMASYIDSAAIVSSGTALVLYQQSIGVTGDEIGVLSATLTLCIAIGAITGGRLGDHFGRRSVFIATMAMIVVGSALLVTAPGFAGLFIGTALVGLGSGADLPVSLATISETATEENRGKLLGFSQVLWFVGIMATSGLGAIVGDMGQRGGQIMFGHVGIVALIVLLFRLTIPESSIWADARQERESGAGTVRAQRVSIKDVLSQRIYLIPFIALLLFYTLTNIGANTNGQFGTYVAVNVVGISVETQSLIGIGGMIVGVLGAFWFMKIADGPRRMSYFVFGAVCLLVGYGLPLLVGFSLPIWLVMQFFGALGGAFAFEAIMKIWSQESFPTLLRSSAQGAIIAVARIVASAVALVTPALATDPKVLYGFITGAVLAGLLAGWLGFHNSRFNTFEVESKDLGQAQDELRAAGIRKDAPVADARRGGARSSES